MSLFNLRVSTVSRIIGDGVVFNFCDHFPLTDKNCVSTVLQLVYISLLL